MQHTLQSIDTAIFYFINQTLHNEFLDWFMPFITEKYHWFPIFFIIYTLLLWKGGKKGRIAALLIIFVILLSDQFSSFVVKPLFARTRPCVELENVRMLIGRKTSWSFPSSHAANSFAAATFFAYYYPLAKRLYFIIASLAAISRVYVGVHYPFDALGGAVIGVGCALAVIYSFNLIAVLITNIRGAKD